MPTPLSLLLLAVLLLNLALPRAIGHLALASGLQATELLLAGKRVAPSGVARAVRAHRSALAWIDDGRLHSRLGALLVMHADFFDPTEVASLLQEATNELLAGLTRNPIDSPAWLTLARVFYEAREPLQAAGALDWAVRTLPYDPDNPVPRCVLGLELWDLLEPNTQAAVAASLLVWFRRAPRDVVLLAIVSDNIDRTAALLARDDGAAKHFAALLAELEREAAAAAAKDEGS